MVARGGAHDCILWLSRYLHNARQLSFSPPLMDPARTPVPQALAQHPTLEDRKMMGLSKVHAISSPRYARCVDVYACSCCALSSTIYWSAYGACVTRGLSALQSDLSTLWPEGEQDQKVASNRRSPTLLPHMPSASISQLPPSDQDQVAGTTHIAYG
jgi:hypothetical protein